MTDIKGTPSVPVFPANSDRAKVEKSTESKVIAKASEKKNRTVYRALSDFVVSDIPEVWEHLVIDVVIPTVKSMLTDMVTQGVQSLLYGNSAPKTRGSYVTYGSRSTTSYSRASAPMRSRPQTRSDDRIRDLEFESNQDLRDMLAFIAEVFDDREVLTVAELKEAAGLKVSYVDDRWGWGREASFRSVVDRGRHVLLVPSPEPLS